MCLYLLLYHFLDLKSWGIWEIKKELENIVLSAFVAAFCFVLGSLAVFKMPFGGSVSLAHTLPLIFLSLKKGYKVGAKSALIFCVLKLMFGFYVPPSQKITSYILVILFDYILPYFLVGISSLYSNIFKEERKNVVFAVMASEFLRFLFFTFSGLLIWNDYFEFGMNVLGLCVAYNLSYMMPNLVISLLMVALIYKNEKYVELVFGHTFL